MRKIKYPFYKGHFDITIKDNKFYKIEIKNEKTGKINEEKDFFYTLFDELIKYNKKIPLKYFVNPGKTDFAKKVYLELYNTNFGETISYKQLTNRVTNKKAYRAVGTLMKNNTLPVIIPCHRVIKSDGTLGNFGNGPEWKKALIENEKIEVIR